MDAAAGFVAGRRPGERVVDRAPRGLDGVEFGVDELAGLGAAPRLGGEAFEDAWPGAAGLVVAVGVEAAVRLIFGERLAPGGVCLEKSSSRAKFPWQQQPAAFVTDEPLGRLFRGTAGGLEQL